MEITNGGFFPKSRGNSISLESLSSNEVSQTSLILYLVIQLKKTHELLFVILVSYKSWKLFMERDLGILEKSFKIQRKVLHPD